MNSPFTGKPMILKTFMDTIEFEGKQVTYQYTGWYCEDFKEYMDTPEQLEENLKRIKEAYQKLIL